MAIKSINILDLSLGHDCIPIVFKSVCSSVYLHLTLFSLQVNLSLILLVEWLPHWLRIVTPTPIAIVSQACPFPTILRRVENCGYRCPDFISTSRLRTTHFWCSFLLLRSSTLPVTTSLSRFKYSVWRAIWSMNIFMCFIVVNCKSLE